MLIGTFLPAGRPDELEALRKQQKSLTAAVDQAMRHPIDRMHATRRRNVRGEPEDAQDPVHVHEKHGKL
jgi:hypothetical protein